MDLVLVTPETGAPFRAARKRTALGACKAAMLAAEVAVLRAGRGCPHVLQLYDVRSTDTHNELLLELMEGGTMAEELVGTGRGRGVGRGRSADGHARSRGPWDRGHRHAPLWVACGAALNGGTQYGSSLSNAAFHGVRYVPVGCVMLHIVLGGTVLGKSRCCLV